MKIPEKLRELLNGVQPANAAIRQMVDERRALLSKRQQEAARLVQHPSDRSDLEAVLTAAIERVIEQSEEKFSTYLRSFIPSPDPAIGVAVVERLAEQLRDPRGHAMEAPELVTLLLPGLIREAVPDLAERMAQRLTAWNRAGRDNVLGDPSRAPVFAPAEMSAAARQARIAELNEECQRLSGEIGELEQQARAVGLAI